MTTLGKYTLHEQLGHGGFANVYRATHNTLGTEAALKVLNPALMEDEKVRQRFTREAQTASALEHPNIVRIIDLDEADGKVFIVMEYLPGSDLNRWRKEHGPLSRADLLRILGQIAGALDYAHEKGMLHRDVKPGNILIDADGRAKLSDFGLVRPPDAPHLTQLGSVVGTATYISPEQAEASPKIDGCADQYSLAVVAYELFAGQPPFHGDNSTAVSLMHITKPPPAPSSLNAEVPAEVDAVFERALAKKPADRYPNCAGFTRALGEAWESSDLRRFQTLLDEARQLLAQGQYTAMRERLLAAKDSLAGRPELGDKLAELEQARQQAEAYEQGVKDWNLARQKAQSVLEQYPDFPDPQGVFTTLELRRPPRRLPTRQELARYAASLLLAACLGAAALYLAWHYIDGLIF